METIDLKSNIYDPKDISANDLIMDAMATIYRQGKIVRDF